MNSTLPPASSPLAKGNLALRNKDYQKAILHYVDAQTKFPELEHLIQGNLEFARKKLAILSSTSSDKNKPSVDIVVPVFNAIEDVKKCLQSLQDFTDDFDVHIIVVNDGSDEKTTQWLRNFCRKTPIFRLIEHERNHGYTKAVNTGLRASTASYVITQNSDTIVSQGWLEGLVRCMNSAPKIGIVGPLSNAASWQSVPALHDQDGNFVVNELPAGMEVSEMARIVKQASSRSYPKLPFVNGFCFMIKREVITLVGYMDDENFPIGYGEENDYCLRTIDAGFELAIADDVYVFHAKSKSFGHGRRKELSKQGTESLKRKHTSEKYFNHVEEVKRTEELDSVRLRIQNLLSKCHQEVRKIPDLIEMRILFLLPVKGGGGGAHSVVQEVTEMQRLGLSVHVAVKYEQISGFHENYEDIPNAVDLFVGFNDDNLIDLAESYDVVVGTIYSSMELVKRIVDVNPYILPAYYVQDYEPMFFEQGTEKWKQAYDSYTLVPNAFLFAKTNWIVRTVENEHGTKVHKVAPSIDHNVYKPRRRSRNGTIKLAAMIRPKTPYRGAERTMRLLSRLYQTFGKKICIHIFGTSENSEEFQSLLHDFPYINHGPLTRTKVAGLLSDSDIFIDLSDYQAFGRTALEAMACGCAAVVPSRGGTDEYAIDGTNALIVDSLNEDATYSDICRMLSKPESLIQMQHQGMLTASRYSAHSAVISECVPISEALHRHRMKHPKFLKPTLIIVPSRRADGLPAGSGYVRVVLPYQSTAVRNHWHVQSAKALPEPGESTVALIQRDLPTYTLEQLRTWHTSWKSNNGKLIYEIDDDLFDSEGLMQRGFKGEASETAEKVRFLTSVADAVTVSTVPLKKKIQPFNQHVYVVPNSLDQALWQLERERNHSIGPYARSANGPIRIGYIGTPTHDADLDLIAPAMREIEAKYGPRVEIEVIGGFQHKTPLFGKRVALPKNTDYPNFVKWLLQRVHWDIGIIPLVNDEFNQSKSNLKFLEYAALDMAILVSQVEAYSSISRNGHNCLAIENNTTAWIDSISNLIENPEMRLKLSSQARDDLRKNWLIKHQANKLKNVLKNLSDESIQPYF